MAGRRGTAEQVAAELAGRITAGALRPGDRVPTTRALVAEHGIAMATASRVHALLRARGLVRTEAGVGTLVTARPPDAGDRGAGRLRPEQGAQVAGAVRQGVRVADAEGLLAVTLRRVAADVALPTMTLHRLVGGKEGLLHRMTQEAVARTAWTDAGDDWHERALVAAGALWRTYRRHPWLATTMGLLRPVAFPSGLDYVETVLAAFTDAGLNREEAFAAHVAVFSTLRGFAVDLEPEAELTARTGLDAQGWNAGEAQRLLTALADGSRPHLAALAAGGVDFDLDALAMGAVRRLLDGVAAAVQGRG